MRMNPEIVREIARQFVTSDRAKLWYFVTSDIRNALVDNVVMDAVRMAHAVDNNTPLTPAQLLEFRAALVKALHDGVPRGSAGRRHFTIDD
jgi:hypothetical protein